MRSECRATSCHVVCAVCGVGRCLRADCPKRTVAAARDRFCSVFCCFPTKAESSIHTTYIFLEWVGGESLFFPPLTFVFRVTLGFCFGGLKYIKKDATIAATWWTEARDQSTYYAKNKKMHAFCVLKSCCAPAVGNRDFCCIYEVPVLFVFSTIDVLLLSYICPVALYMSDVLCVIRYKVSGVFVI